MDDFYPTQGSETYALYVTESDVSDSEHCIDTIPLGGGEANIVMRKGVEFESVHDPYPEKYHDSYESRWYVPTITLFDCAEQISANDDQFTVTSLRTVENEYYGSVEEFHRKASSEPRLDALWVSDGNGVSMMVDRRGNIIVNGHGDDVENQITDMVETYISHTDNIFRDVCEIDDEFGIDTVESQFVGETDVSRPLCIGFPNQIQKHVFDTVREKLYDHRLVVSQTRGNDDDTFFQHEMIDTHTYNRIKLKYHHNDARLFAYDDNTLGGMISLVCLLVDAHNETDITVTIPTKSD